MTSSARTVIAGSAIVLRGNDIDTDRVMPARFLRAITFDGLEAHIFEDDRKSLRGQGAIHPFDDPARRHARILMVDANFGCGSSREHAPQAIVRWGIQAVVGESFAEIFFGNAVAIGLPCVTIARADLTRIVEAAERAAHAIFTVDLQSRTVSGAGITAAATMPDTARGALVTGQWDATSQLLERYADVERVANALPYTRGFEG